MAVLLHTKHHDEAETTDLGNNKKTDRRLPKRFLEKNNKNDSAIHATTPLDHAADDESALLLNLLKNAQQLKYHLIILTEKQKR